MGYGPVKLTRVATLPKQSTGAPPPTPRQLNALIQAGDTTNGLLTEMLAQLAALTEALAPPNDPAGEQPYRNSTSIKLELGRVVKSGPTRLYGFSGYNSNAAAQFIQAHDTVAIPSAGAVPAFVMTAAATANFYVAWTPAFRSFFAGCVLVNSSTAATYTAGVNDCWFDAQYL